MTEQPEKERDQLSDDVQSLSRGFWVNVLGYIPKIAYPLLLVFVVRLYGQERYGVFKVAEALIMFGLYLALLGLDRGILWWIPRQTPENERRGLKGVLLYVGGAAAIVTLGTIALAPLFANWKGRLDATASLRIMALSLAPMALMQLLVHTAFGKRAVGAQVFVREALVSAVLAGGAIALFYSPLAEHGLSLAFVCSNVAGVLGAMVYFRHSFRHSRWPREGWHPPSELWRFSLPMWLTGFVAAAMGRIDMVGIAALTDQRSAGIYAAALDVGRAVRTVHVSFSQIVLALASEISLSGDRKRLVAGFSYATVLVMGILLPLCMLLVSFAPWIMQIFGKGFDAGTHTLVIVTIFATIEGIFGLNGLLVSGYGHSKLTLINMCITVACQIPLLKYLVPQMGISGAAMAVGVAFSVQNALQLVQARWVSGGWNYSRDVLELALWAITGGMLAWLTRTLVAGFGPLVAASGGFVAFAATFGCGLLRTYRKSKSVP